MFCYNVFRGPNSAGHRRVQGTQTLFIFQGLVLSSDTGLLSVLTAETLTDGPGNATEM